MKQKTLKDFDQAYSLDEYQKEIKQEKLNHKELRKQRKNKRDRWSD